MQFTKDESCYNVNDLIRVNFIPGEFYVIWVNVNTMRIQSRVNRPDYDVHATLLMYSFYNKLKFDSKVSALNQ